MEISNDTPRKRSVVCKGVKKIPGVLSSFSFREPIEANKPLRRVIHLMDLYIDKVGGEVEKMTTKGSFHNKAKLLLLPLTSIEKQELNLSWVFIFSICLEWTRVSHKHNTSTWKDWTRSWRMETAPELSRRQFQLRRHCLGGLGYQGPLKDFQYCEWLLRKKTHSCAHQCQVIDWQNLTLMFPFLLVSVFVNNYQLMIIVVMLFIHVVVIGYNCGHILASSLWGHLIWNFKKLLS